MSVDGRLTSAPRTATPRSASAQAVGESAGTYTVQPGDSLSRIAQRELGNGRRYLEIARLNPDLIKDPDKIRPGMVLKLPARRAPRDHGSPRMPADSVVLQPKAPQPKPQPTQDVAPVQPKPETKPADAKPEAKPTQNLSPTLPKPETKPVGPAATQPTPTAPKPDAAPRADATPAATKPAHAFQFKSFQAGQRRPIEGTYQGYNFTGTGAVRKADADSLDLMLDVGAHVMFVNVQAKVHLKLQRQGDNTMMFSAERLDGGSGNGPTNVGKPLKIVSEKPGELVLQDPQQGKVVVSQSQNGALTIAYDSYKITVK